MSRDGGTNVYSVVSGYPGTATYCNHCSYSAGGSDGGGDGETELANSMGLSRILTDWSV